MLRIVEELSACNERILHLLDGQRMQLEVLFRELVAVDIFDCVASTAVSLVREALSIIQDFVEQHEWGCSND